MDAGVLPAPEPARHRPTALPSWPCLSRATRLLTEALGCIRGMDWAWSQGSCCHTRVPRRGSRCVRVPPSHPVGL